MRRFLRRHKPLAATDPTLAVPDAESPVEGGGAAHIADEVVAAVLYRE